MKNNIVKESLLLSFSKFFTLGISLVTAMLLSRYRTLEEYGTFSQLLLITNLALAIISLGLPNSINFFLTDEKQEERAKFLSVYYTISMILSLISGLLLVVCVSQFIDYFQNDQLRYFIYFFAVFPWTQFMLQSIDKILIVYKKVKILFIFQILYGFFQLLIIIFTKIFNLGFGNYVLLFVIVQIIFAVFVFIIVKILNNNIRIFIDRKYAFKIFMYSIPIGLSTLIGTLNTQIDKLIIGKYFSTSEMAIYTNAARELPFAFIAASFSAIILPQIIKKVKENKIPKAIYLWGNVTYFNFIIISFLVFGVITFGNEVIELLYSTKYIGGVRVFQIYTLIILLRTTYFGMILNAKGKTNYILYSSIAAFIVNIVLNFIFYHYFGFIGPAIASLLSMFLMVIFQLYVTSKLIRVKILELFPTKKIMNVLIINIILSVCFIILKKIIGMEKLLGNIMESITLAIIWGLIYLIIERKNLTKTWKSISFEEEEG
ncbi:MAG: oligosaccharide flippase family protein [Bacilli bacterium]|nr:oligosaccharide flippase family protein [Bacilli bacterium]